MKIDILMPFYGDPEQFKEAVRSVIAQDDPGWRLVVVNDCYPHWDPTAWLSSLGDARVSLIRNPENLGVSGSFNACIDAASAEYVTILGCDDRLLPNYVALMKKLIRELDRPEYLQPAVSIINEMGRPAKPLADWVKHLIKPKLDGPTILQGEELAVSLMRGNWTYFPAICWQTEQLRRFRFSREYEIVLDLVLQTEVIVAGGRLGCTDEVAFEYRRHTSSASSSSASLSTRFLEERDCYREASQKLRARGWIKAARAARNRVTSRLNAITRLPVAARRLDLKATAVLWRHLWAS